MNTKKTIFSLCVAILLFTNLTLVAQPPKPTAINENIRNQYKLDPFYKKYVAGVEPIIIGSDKVTDNAMAEAAWIVNHMLKDRADIRKAMVANKVKVAIIAAEESTTDIPEHSFLRTKMYWDRRARGLGATVQVPVISASEENLLNYIRDPYPNECIFVHEFAHAIHGTGLNTVDPTFDERLKTSFEKATARGLWKNSYAATNKEEYWAEGVQCWFDNNSPPDALHNEISTRVQLKSYDPDLAKLCKEVFGEGTWKYVKPAKRNPTDLKHLANYDSKKLPRFKWREYPISDKPVVQIQSSAGDIDVEIDIKTHPEAARNFLKIALDGGFHSGDFNRVQRSTDGSGWIGASTKKQWQDDYAKELTLEAVNKDGLPNQIADGTIAMLRKGTVGQFVIFTGKPKPDATNLVPIGKVVKGIEIVKSVQKGKATGENLNTKIDIRRVIRSE